MTAQSRFLDAMRARIEESERLAEAVRALMDQAPAVRVIDHAEPIVLMGRDLASPGA